MLGDSSEMGSPGEAMAAVATTTTTATGGAHEGNEFSVIGSNSGEEDKVRNMDEGDRSFGGNRWPRQESLALLKIRSEMDAAFRDSSLKGPLWEEVSRKLAELGYNRSAKKCKEKFENVYKYHKRTKDGRTGKPDGKTYRFFDQLEALENLHHTQHQSPSPPKPQTPMPTATQPLPSSSIIVPPKTFTNPTNAPHQNTAAAAINPMISTAPAKQTLNPYKNNAIPNFSFQNASSNLFSTSNSSSTASDEETSEGSSRRKRKWKQFFKRLTKEVIEKQEDLQRKFLETIERQERERMAREESWRIQEMSRINREHEILVQERSTSAVKDAAVIAFLQKISGGKLPNTAVQMQVQGQPQENNQVLQPPPQPQQAPPAVINFDTPKMNNGENSNVIAPSPSRWPKAEVQALIQLRTSLETQYLENGSKAPLWEEISSRMKRLGYNRSAKRCKEKWENINKYFKKVKESNKKRPEDSKTCPYFHQLDAIYKEKSIKSMVSNKVDNINTMVPLMVRPEQQWPPQQEDNVGKEENVEDDQNQIHEEEEEDGSYSDEEEDDDEGNGYEIVANKASSAAVGTAS